MDLRFIPPSGTLAALNTLASTGGLEPGELLWVSDVQRLATALTTTAWAFVSPRGIAFPSRAGLIPTNDEWIAAPSPFAFTATAAGSPWRCKVRPAAPITASVRQGGAQVGTIQFVTTSDLANVTVTNGVTPKEGVVSILWPATADNALAGVSGRWGE